MRKFLNLNPEIIADLPSEKNDIRKENIYAVFADDVVNKLGVEEYFKKIFPKLDQGEIDSKILGLKEKIIHAKIEGSPDDEIRNRIKLIIESAAVSKEN